MINSLYWLFAFCIVGYFLGNINPALIITRIRKVDIKKAGSGNPGAMNVMRQLGFKLGMLTLLIDALKGAIPALIAFVSYGGRFDIGQNLSPENSYIALYATGLAVILGHCFPVFLKFKGGKGFASMIGVFMIAHPWVSLLMFAIMAIYIAIAEYGAMGSFIYITVMVTYAALQEFNLNYGPTVHILLLAFYFLSWYTHRTNIQRLLVGKENTVTFLKAFNLKRLRKKQEKWLNSLRDGENNLS